MQQSDCQIEIVTKSPFQITFAVLVNAVIILPSVRPCLDIASLFAEYRSRLTPAAVASSPTAAALTSSAALNALLVGAIAGTNCIRMGLPGKLILSKRKGLREVLFS